MPQNRYGQPVGPGLGEWTSPPPPPPDPLEGRYVALTPLSPDDVPGLWEALATADESFWTYMAFGPFPDLDALATTIRSLVATPGWLPYVIEVAGRPVGFASYLRIDAHAGTIEIGSIVFSPQLQRTTAATEAIYLLIDRAFALGYRRVEWKCDDLNEPSRRAAVRYGFTYEGTFRKATHYKGRNRDTAWYAIIDDDWPRIRAAFDSWLDPSNFDESGRQMSSLSSHLAARG